ncbi:hypothetical protein PsAD37_03838 [Pseudovibrio sp. Ad37]|nr:hypothetical protein PsAD37_03838 [Pseudovibrio sp. Ad37]
MTSAPFSNKRCVKFASLANAIQDPRSLGVLAKSSFETSVATHQPKTVEDPSQGVCVGLGPPSHDECCTNHSRVGSLRWPLESLLCPS